MCSRVSDDISVSNCEHTLSEYAATLPKYCSLMHKSTCSVCPAFLSVAKKILENGFVQLAEAFKSAFPQVTYHSNSAKRRLLQLPLAAIPIGEQKSGVSEVYFYQMSTIGSSFTFSMHFTVKS